MTYDQYLDSDHWRNFRKEYLAANPCNCRVCGTTDRIDLHHCTYANIGCETFDDVIPLCRAHHDALHKWLSSNHASVRHTAYGVAALRFTLGFVEKMETVTRPNTPSVDGPEEEFRRFVKAMLRGARSTANRFNPYPTEAVF